VISLLDTFSYKLFKKTILNDWSMVKVHNSFNAYEESFFLCYSAYVFHVYRTWSWLTIYFTVILIRTIAIFDESKLLWL